MPVNWEEGISGKNQCGLGFICAVDFGAGGGGTCRAGDRELWSGQIVT